MASHQALRILVVMAHPHDFTHVSGTCGKHVDRGDHVTVVSATGGQNIHNEPLERELRKPKELQDAAVISETDQQYVARKGHELDDVCEVFGIKDVRVLPFRDSHLEPSDQLDQAIVDIILDVRPHLLLTHAPFSVPGRGRTSAGPDDHRVTGIAVERAVGLAGAPNRETRARPHRIAKTLYTGIEWYHSDWDLIIDITDQVTRRVRSEAMFKTQGHSAGFALKRIQVGSGVAGWSGGFPYGEAFLYATRNLDDCLRVSDIEMNQAERPSMERMAAVGTRVEDILEQERDRGG